MTSLKRHVFVGALIALACPVQRTSLVKCLYITHSVTMQVPCSAAVPPSLKTWQQCLYTEDDNKYA